MYKAVIFDLDGVLVDASRWHFESLNRALKIFGFDIQPDEHKRLYEGLPTNSKLEMLSKNHSLPVALHRLIWRLKQKYTNRTIAEHCGPDIEKLELLRLLRDRGLKLAVCSNAIGSTVETMLERSGLLEFFPLTLSNEDVSQPKPNPEIYLKAFKMLGVLPSECLIVEDSEHGKEAAIRSGAALLPVTCYREVNVRTILAAFEHSDDAVAQEEVRL